MIRHYVVAVTAGLLLAACQPQAPSPAPADPAPAAEAGMPETGPEDTGAAMCGGIAGISCSDGFYCAMPVGACVNTADMAGTCQEMPFACTQQYEPVCGCDGETYGNECTAASAGVNIAYEGECSETEGG